MLNKIPRITLDDQYLESFLRTKFMFNSRYQTYGQWLCAVMQDYVANSKGVWEYSTQQGTAVVVEYEQLVRVLTKLAEWREDVQNRR